MKTTQQIPPHIQARVDAALASGVLPPKPTRVQVLSSIGDARHVDAVLAALAHIATYDRIDPRDSRRCRRVGYWLHYPDGTRRIGPEATIGSGDAIVAAYVGAPAPVSAATETGGTR